MRAGTVASILTVAHLGVSGVGPARGQSVGADMGNFEPSVYAQGETPLAYRLYAPTRWQEPRRLLVMLHGCTQDARDLAVGTGLNDLAEEGGFAVLYPEQSADAHPQKCWSWYEPAAAEAEAQAIHGLMREVAEANQVSDVLLAGISAGGAMANVLVQAYPDDFRGVAIHSGIALGAAAGVAQALTAMQAGGPTESVHAATEALAAQGGPDAPGRVVVIHGADDAVVAPVNGIQVAEQWAAVLDARLRRGGAPGLSAPSTTAREEGGRSVDTRVWRDAEGMARVTLVAVHGLGHAWSGGRSGGTYADPAGPSASRMVVQALGLLP